MAHMIKFNKKEELNHKSMASIRQLETAKDINNIVGILQYAKRTET